jgi:hypothetical protein
MAPIGEDEGDGENDGGELQLSGMIPTAEMGAPMLPKVNTVSSNFRFLPLEFVWALAAARWESPTCRTPVSTGIPVASPCSHFTELGYVVKAVLMMVSLPRLMTARACMFWHMSPPASWMDGRWDGVREKSLAASFTTTQAEDVPVAQGSGSLLDDRWL